MSDNNQIVKGNSSLNQEQLSYSRQQNVEELTLNDYFHSYPIKDIGNYMVSTFYSEKILSGLEILINIGAVMISQKRKTAQSLMDQQTIDQQQLKAIQQKQKKEFMRRQLEFLTNQTRPTYQQDQPQNLDAKNLVLTKEEHKALAERFKRQFMQRQKRHQQLLFLQSKKQEEQQEKRRKSLQEKQQIQRRLRREQIQSNLNDNKKRKQKLLKLQKQSNQKIKSIKENKAVYERFQQRYRNQIFLPILQEKQKFLQQIRQQKSFSIEKIKEHQKSYLQKKQLHQSRRTIFHDDWSYDPPYKSQRLNVILQEEKLQKIKKIQEKKSQIQQNLTRHAQYAAYLRRNFVPKIDPAKKEQIQLRIQKPKGIRPQSLDYKTIGMTYLQQAKRKRKKIRNIEQRADDESSGKNITNTPYLTGQKSKQQKNTPLSNQLRTHKDEKTYIIRKRENLKKLLRSVELNDPEKIKQLSIQASKTDQCMQRKQLQLKYKKDKKTEDQALQFLLSSIQAKIGIIQTYN